MTDQVMLSSHLAQAKLFAEVARRTERPFDALPAGDVSQVLLRLWQEAARSALAAAAEASSLEAPRLTQLPLALRAAASPMTLVAIEHLLNRPSAARSTDVSTDARLVAMFAERLIAELEVPSRRRELQRWRTILLRVLAIVVAATALAVGGYLIARPDLTRHATRSLSSSLGNCQSGECGDAELHTNEEYQPWVKYDLGSLRTLHSISVKNRLDCCYDRAVPLIVEVSDDNRSWRELTRTEKPFITWSTALSGRARYVRLRVNGKAYLHLRDVVIR